MYILGIVFVFVSVLVLIFNSGFAQVSGSVGWLGREDNFWESKERKEGANPPGLLAGAVLLVVGLVLILG